MISFILRCAAVAGIAALAALPAFAQKIDWPTRPVRFIVPFPPGGTTDPMARMVGAKLNASLGQQFIVDNQPDVHKQMSETLGMDLVVSNPAALQKFLVSEIARWGKVVRENNIRAD